MLGFILPRPAACKERRGEVRGRVSCPTVALFCDYGGALSAPTALLTMWRGLRNHIPPVRVLPAWTHPGERRSYNDHTVIGDTVIVIRDTVPLALDYPSSAFLANYFSSQGT